MKNIFKRFFRKPVLTTNGGQKIFDPDDEQEVQKIISQETKIVRKKAKKFYKDNLLSQKDIEEIWAMWNRSLSGMMKSKIRFSGQFREQNIIIYLDGRVTLNDENIPHNEIIDLFHGVIARGIELENPKQRVREQIAGYRRRETERSREKLREIKALKILGKK